MAKTDWKDNGTPVFNANRHGKGNTAAKLVAQGKARAGFAELSRPSTLIGPPRQFLVDLIRSTCLRTPHVK